MTNREYIALADALVRGYKRCPIVMYVDRKLK